MIAVHGDLTEYNPLEAYTKGEPLQDLMPEPEDLFIPPFPKKVEELGIHPNFLADLALKAVAVEADCTTASVARRLHLGTD